jgi:hypothetical protein
MKPFQFGNWQLFDAMDALMAFDRGATDSGIHDDDLKDSVRTYLEGLEEKEFRQICARYARRFLSKKGLEAGYGLEDVQHFIDWLSQIGICV